MFSKVRVCCLRSTIYFSFQRGSEELNPNSDLHTSSYRITLVRDQGNPKIKLDANAGIEPIQQPDAG